MQRFLICAFFAVLGGAVFASNDELFYDSDKDPYIFEDLINSTIEAIREDLPEPIVIENLTIAIPDNDVLSGGADLLNLEITGIKGFQVTSLNMGFTMVLNFTFVLPSINVNTDYWGDLLLLDLIPLYGEGKANIHLQDVEIQGSAHATLAPSISVNNLRIQVYLGGSTFDIHGALDNEEFSAILSQVLNDVVTTFIDNHQTVISDIISPIIENLINAILAGTSTDTTTVAPDTTVPIS